MKKNFLKNNFGGIAALGVLCLTLTMSFFSVLTEYGLMLKKKGELQDSLDVTNSWVVSHYLNLLSEGKTIDPQKIRDLALGHFQMNMRLGSKDSVEFKLELPSLEKEFLKITAGMVYTPVFLNVLGGFLPRRLKEEYTLVASAESAVSFEAESFEIALVVDVSGTPLSHTRPIGYKNINPLKRELIRLLTGIREKLGKSAKVAIVPFATFVNLGTKALEKSQEMGLDAFAESPKHWSHFDFPFEEDKIVFIEGKSFSPYRKIVGVSTYSQSQNLQYFKKGVWPKNEINTQVTRFSLFKDMRLSVLSANQDKNTFLSWQGCVESPIYPYNISDQLKHSNPKSLFVPTFYPDHPFEGSMYAMIDYWPDTHGKNPIQEGPWGEFEIQKSMIYYGLNPRDPGNRDYTKLNSFGMLFNDIRKYYIPFAYIEGLRELYPRLMIFTHASVLGESIGPNLYCHNFPIVPLQDIVNERKFEELKDAINKFQYTRTHANLVEGFAWGWRVLSENLPFKEGRPYDTPGNKKIIILVTQGRNYFTMEHDKTGLDHEGNKIHRDVFEPFYAKVYPSLYHKNYFWSYSGYNAYGYGHYSMQQMRDAFAFRKKEAGPIVDLSYNHFASFLKEMNVQMEEVCTNIKKEGIAIMTVVVGAASVNEPDFFENKTILENCSSSWPTNKDNNLKKSPKNKMFWDADDSGLPEAFSDISTILFS